MTDLPTPTEDKETLNRFFSADCKFILAAALHEHLESLPAQELPELAFWGRSNVGKSSLINAIMNRKGLARTSVTPGRTQQIIFFNHADALLIADMPGYGFAKAPKGEIKKWTALIAHYLQSRRALRCVLLLIDGRHGLLKADEEQMKALDTWAVNYQVVLTKTDKIPAAEAAETVRKVEAALRKHPAARPTAILSSAEKGTGIEEIRRFILTIAQGG